MFNWKTLAAAAAFTLAIAPCLAQGIQAPTANQSQSNQLPHMKISDNLTKSEEMMRLKERRRMGRKHSRSAIKENYAKRYNGRYPD
jgi:hypothetical protein